MLSAATFTVTDTTDASANSLRAAITASNANNPGAGFNTIDFDITGTGVQTINLLSALPMITEPVLINGYSEAGASANTLANSDNAVILIQLNGASAGASADGLLLGSGSGGSTIEGLAINRFSLNGIESDSNGNVISGNFVGTNPAGTAAEANQLAGINITGASDNTIGGTTPAARNVASGNYIDGIHVIGSLSAPATDNMIEGNFVGVNAAGTGSVGIKSAGGAAGTPSGNNYFGIEISGGDTNTVGGATAGARNVVGLNAAGIEVDDGGQYNVIQGNYSGVGADGVTPVGNSLHGIVLRSAGDLAAPLGPGQANEPPVTNNLIGGTAPGDGNLVEFNGTAGVAVFGNPLPNNAMPQANNDNAILGNSIFENGRSNPTFLLGIDLSNEFTFPKDDGITPNDSQGHSSPNDPNNFEDFPVLTSATPQSGGGTTIAGSVESVGADEELRIEFFSNDPDPMGGVAEGQTFLGFTNITTNGSGTATFSVKVAGSATIGQTVTATATDTAGNTSEFSAPVKVGRAPSVIHASDLGGVYNGKSFPATGYVYGAGNSIIATPVFTYYLSTDKTLSHPLSGAPSTPGSYAYVATFAGNAEYLPTSTSGRFSISIPVTSLAAVPFHFVAGTTFTGVVAQFNAPAGLAASLFSATVSFGDGTTSTATVSAGAKSGQFKITASHKWAKATTYKITITLLPVGSAALTTSESVS